MVPFHSITHYIELEQNERKNMADTRGTATTDYGLNTPSPTIKLQIPLCSSLAQSSKCYLYY